MIDKQALLERLNNTPYEVEITPCEGYEGAYWVSAKDDEILRKWEQSIQPIIKAHKISQEKTHAN